MVLFSSAGKDVQRLFKAMYSLYSQFRLARVFFGLSCIVGMTAFLLLGPLLALPTAAQDAAAELRTAFQEAAREAKASDDLDPAYELLGIAETAQQQNLPQIAAQAATAFADLVRRATVKAREIQGSVMEDVLDQFVDLRFMARTANLPLPQAALDDALVTLFPAVAANVQRKVDQAASWTEKLAFVDDLADLQASATQIMKQDVARDLGHAFERKLGQLEELARQAPDMHERVSMLESLSNTRKSRDERLIDANANNLNVVAALMQNPGARQTDVAGSRSPSEVDVPEELAAGTRSCIETGFTGQQDPSLMRRLQTNCINSGRLPAEGRCSTNNLAFLCYDAAPGGEKVTYVYRDTPEELYFRDKCTLDKLLKADDLPATGASFRARNAVLGFTCAPHSP